MDIRIGYCSKCDETYQTPHIHWEWNKEKGIIAKCVVCGAILLLSWVAESIIDEYDEYRNLEFTHGNERSIGEDLPMRFNRTVTTSGTTQYGDSLVSDGPEQLT